MKWNYVIIIISLFSIAFVSISEEEINTVNKCGYNNVDIKSTIVEDNDKCFRYYKKETNKETKRLMIVAHPDDEAIFGGAHLLEKKYTVVCITCGSVDYRVEEFKEVMNRTKDDYIMLGFTDRIDKTGPISNWDNEYEGIYIALKNIIDSEDWDLIVTHNPDGEYGHIHHKKTSEIVTNITSKNNLYYFGHWYKKDIPGKKITENLYNRKMNELISIYYESQKNALNYNYNILPYENWIKGVEW